MNTNKMIKVQLPNGQHLTFYGIDAYLQVIQMEFSGLYRYNEMTGRAEVNRSDDEDHPLWENFTDSDLSKLRYLFERKYSINNRSDLDDALAIVFQQNTVNPVTDMLDALAWDGVERIRHFLTDMLGAEESAYTQEVSRLIFAGGVHRAYHPGCKFDDMPVLIGRQGGGKSSIVRMLNINDEFFREVTTIEGKEGIEALNGGWICEFSEMMAMTNIKEVEGVKAYITRQSDHVRKAYGRYESDLKRRCMFIGTTNNERFLTDKTGNRRFYPVQVTISGYELLDREPTIREYIKQCWAEAVALFRKGELKPYADRSLREEYERMQNAAREDDWREGAIAAYLESKAVGEYTCVVEVFNECLKGDTYTACTRKDSIDIGKIISQIPGWQRSNVQKRFGKMGLQRCYVKKQAEPCDKNAPEEVETPDDIPF